MWGMLLNIFKRKTTSQTSFPYPETKDEKLAFDWSFPPVDQGIPVVSPDALLKRQHRLVEEIRNTAGLSRNDFAKIYYPVIQRVAAFVHLLPASREHHHFTTGGLLRHSLEVGHYALRYSNGKIFDGGENTERRRHTTPRWRFAAFVTGLCHDLGKPVSDMIVTDANGKNRWNPYDESLYDWATRNKHDRYFMHWNDKRVHGEHERFNSLVLNSVLPKDSYAYLSDYGINIMSDVLSAVSGSADNLVSELMHSADKESVTRNLKGSLDLMQVRKQPKPIESHLIEAIRHLANHKWPVNVPGARIWVSDESVFLLWSLACVDVRNYLNGNGVEGIPADPDTLAKLLIDRGLAVPNEDEHGRITSYWEVVPKIKNANATRLEVLRIDRIDLIFDDLPPRKHKVELVGHEGEVTGEEFAPEPEVEATTIDSADTSPEVAISAKAQASENDKAIEESSVEQASPEPPTQKEETDQTNQETPNPVEQAMAPEVIQAYEVLEGVNSLNYVLRAIAEDARDGKLTRNKDYVLDEKYLTVVHPRVLDDYGLDPGSTLTALDEAMLLVVDPMKPNLKVQTVKAGKKVLKGFTLHKKISDAARVIIESKPQPPTQQIELPAGDDETLEKLLEKVEGNKEIAHRDKDTRFLWVNYIKFVQWYAGIGGVKDAAELLDFLNESPRTLTTENNEIFHSLEGQKYLKFNWPEKA
jgi:conjugal transfer pilus assembly protein TraI